MDVFKENAYYAENQEDFLSCLLFISIRRYLDSIFKQSKYLNATYHSYWNLSHLIIPYSIQQCNTLHFQFNDFIKFLFHN